MLKNKLLLAMALALPISNPLLAADSPAAAPVEQQQPQKAMAYLGVSVGPVPESVQAQLPKDVSENQGLMVLRALPGSPAENAGIQRHDVLLSINGKALMLPKDLVAAVRSAQPGDKVTLELLRHGQIQKLNVALGMHPMARNRPMHKRRAPGHVQVWESFEALSIEKGKDGQYTAKVETRDQDGNHKTFQFQGDLEEVKKQINQEKELAPMQKRQLINALDGHPPMMPEMPDFDELEREFFTPPPWFFQRRPGFWD